MANYVFTDFMKRHERVNVCVKLYNEMVADKTLQRIYYPLTECIRDKKRHKNLFKPRKEPICAVKTSVYKGVSFYMIVDEYNQYTVIMNTSPVDAGYVEFVKVVAVEETAAIIFTQHALDRYNQRVHGSKYDNHRDIIKRLIANNPISAHARTDEKSQRTVQRIQEGFLCGRFDREHKCMIFNTFFDTEEELDNRYQMAARHSYSVLGDLTEKQLTMFYYLENQHNRGLISTYQYEQLLKHFKISY